MYTYWIGSLVY